EVGGGEGLFARLERRAPPVLGVVFDPAWAGGRLRELAVRPGGHRRVVADDHGPDARGPRVDGQDCRHAPEAIAASGRQTNRALESRRPVPTGGRMRLGILCGGGPAPGMNSVISAATIEARNTGWDVVGILDGFSHLIEADPSHVQPLDIGDVSRIHQTGGSILYTSRANPTVRDES